MEIRTMVDKMSEFVGKKPPVPYPSGKKTLEELFAELEKLGAEEKRFAMEVVVEEEKKRIRQIQLDQLEKVITFDDIMRWKQAHSLCRSIAKWAMEE